MQRLILMNTYILGRASVQEIAEKCWCKAEKMYRYLPKLEKMWWLKSFNLAREWSGAKYAVFYKLYWIHNDYIENMKNYFATIRNPENGESSEWQWSENLNIVFTIDGDKYEWCPDRRCMLKNWKPTGVVSDIQKQTANWMRGKSKNVGKSVRIPQGATEMQEDRVREVASKVRQEIVKWQFEEYQPVQILPDGTIYQPGNPLYDPALQ